MPKELPPVDLEHPSDLDFIVHAVHAYALDIGSERLRTRGRNAASLQDTMKPALSRGRIFQLICFAVDLCCSHTSHTQCAHQWSCTL